MHGLHINTTVVVMHCARGSVTSLPGGYPLRFGLQGCWVNGSGGAVLVLAPPVAGASSLCEDTCGSCSVRMTAGLTNGSSLRA